VRVERSDARDDKHWQKKTKRSLDPELQRHALVG